MRVSNWPALLTAAIDDAKTKPFAWGVHDCCMNAANLIQAITGVDPAASFRGTYSTESEAQAIIEAAGGLVALIDGIAAQNGWTKCRPLNARRGDLVVCFQKDTQTFALGVCTGRNAVFVSPFVGMIFQPIENCVNAWRVD